MIDISNFLIKIGFFTIIIGFILKFLPNKIPLLPGDIFYQKDGFVFYFPFVTSLVISLLMTLFINLFK